MKGMYCFANRIWILLFLFFYGFQCSLAQVVPTNTGSRILHKDAIAILAHHNEARRAVGVPPLAWSTTLAAYAQRWADQLASSDGCKIRHRRYEEQEGKMYGENIFWGSNTNYYKPIDASISWYQEKEHYQYQPFSSSTVYKIGHYTQMIWGHTRYMGVGVATCVHNAIFVVANYDPTGNFVGEFPY